MLDVAVAIIEEQDQEPVPAAMFPQASERLAALTRPLVVVETTDREHPHDFLAGESGARLVHGINEKPSPYVIPRKPP